MVNWFKQLFSETSDVSMTRFLSFVCVVNACLLSIYGVYNRYDVSTLVTVFLTAGLGAKVTQKFIEERSSSKGPAIEK